jgi:hypothetical protein
MASIADTTVTSPWRERGSSSIHAWHYLAYVVGLFRLRLRPNRNSIADRRSIFGNGRIDLVRPGQDAALQIENLSETGLPQEIDSLGRTLATAAMRDDFAR